MTWNELTSDVFDCMHCAGFGLPFDRIASGKFYRFPPTIGAVGQAALLFVGINPRVSDSNRHLHDAIVEDKTRFMELAQNRVGRDEYIGAHGLERHYSLHVRVVEALFPNSRFDSVASVTELHFCASRSSQGLPYRSSRCAERYFRQVLDVVSPRVVFAVGAHVERTLSTLLGFGPAGITAKWSTGEAPVILLPHPNSFGPKRAIIDAAVANAKKYVGESHSNGGSV